MSLYRCTVFGTAAGQAIQQRIWLNTDTSIATQVEASAVATGLADAWQTNVLPILSSAYAFLGVDAVSRFDPTIGATVARSAAGAVAGDMAPTFITAKWRFVTGRRGALGRTRIGVGPLSETQLVGNTLGTTERSTMQTRATAFLAALSNPATVGELSAVSLIEDGVERPAALIAEVTSISVQSLLGSQVGRKAS